MLGQNSGTLLQIQRIMKRIVNLVHVVHSNLRLETLRKWKNSGVNSASLFSPCNFWCGTSSPRCQLAQPFLGRDEPPAPPSCREAGPAPSASSSLMPQVPGRAPPAPEQPQGPRPPGSLSSRAVRVHSDFTASVISAFRIFASLSPLLADFLFQVSVFVRHHVSLSLVRQGGDVPTDFAVCVWVK